MPRLNNDERMPAIPGGVDEEPVEKVAVSSGWWFGSEEENDRKKLKQILAQNPDYIADSIILGFMQPMVF